MIPQPSVILFDWDSTLVDNWDSVTKAWNVALVTLGRPAVTRIEAIDGSKYPPQENFLNRFGDDHAQGRSIFYETLNSIECKSALKILVGSEDLLGDCRSRDIPLGIVSNKAGPILRQEIDIVGWANRFDVIVGSGDAAFDKPRPDPILFALATMGRSADASVWMVGDMHSDIEAAKRAGISAILIETTASLGLGIEGNFDTHQPDLRVSNASALQSFIGRSFDSLSV